MKIHISYQGAIRYGCVDKIFTLWIKISKAETSTWPTIKHEWEKGTLDLLIERNDFFELIKEIDRTLRTGKNQP